MRPLLLLLALNLFFSATPARAPDQIPVFQIITADSEIRFNVKASVKIEGKFDKWAATFSTVSRDVSTGVLDIKIQADSVDTGSGMKDDKLKSKGFFNVKHDPYITFHSTTVNQTGPDSFDLPGSFTIRGVSKPETVTFTSADKDKGTGEVKGTMAFDRKEYGMNSGIPFIRIADRVEVTVDLKIKRVSGPPLIFKE